MAKQIKVLAISFEPHLVDSWNSADDLMRQYTQEMGALSDGIANYRIVERRVYDVFPCLDYIEQYTPETYQAALDNDRDAIRDIRGHYPMMDYSVTMAEYRIYKDIQRGIYDEVWLFGGPYFGFYESRMIGKDAYWCNAPPLMAETRNFVVMGFSYERSVKEMLHNFGHRVESILQRSEYAADFEEWTKEVGTVHQVPGGKDYTQDEREWLSALMPMWWQAAAHIVTKETILQCLRRKVDKWINRII